MSDCVFCDIVNGQAPATIVKDWPGGLAIVPKNPVVDGHVIVIPKRHVSDAADETYTTGMIATYAADLAAERCESFNLITSKGSPASQTQFHLHWHVVPRIEGDGLALPWTGQVKT
jgi:histidine triad (HIT) family protein